MCPLGPPLDPPLHVIRPSVQKHLKILLAFHLNTLLSLCTHTCLNLAFRFGFESSSYSVIESEGVVSVCLTADRGDGSEVYTVTLSYINVTTQGKR